MAQNNSSLVKFCLRRNLVVGFQVDNKSISPTTRKKENDNTVEALQIAKPVPSWPSYIWPIPGDTTDNKTDNGLFFLGLFFAAE